MKYQAITRVEPLTRQNSHSLLSIKTRMSGLTSMIRPIECSTAVATRSMNPIASKSMSALEGNSF